MPIDDQKIGELIGNVAGLSQSFATMQQAQERGRIEVIDIFREMRNDVKDLAKQTAISAETLSVAMTAHMKEDMIAHNNLENLVEWRKDVETRFDQVWDERNKTKGILSASRLGGGAIWAIIAIGIGYFLPGKH